MIKKFNENKANIIYLASPQGLTELLLFCTRVEVKVSLLKITWVEVKVNL